MSLQRRIHIIGTVASGKTTLARRLSTSLNIPFYELDDIAYESGARVRRQMDMRLADVERIVRQSAWIIEGSYIWWIKRLLQMADTIVWIDLPWRITSWRIITRHIKADLAGNNPYSGYCRLLHFYTDAKQYYHDNTLKKVMPMDTDGLYNATTLNYQLLPYATKIIRCRRSAEVEKMYIKIVEQAGRF